MPKNNLRLYILRKLKKGKAENAEPLGLPQQEVGLGRVTPKTFQFFRFYGPKIQLHYDALILASAKLYILRTATSQLPTVQTRANTHTYSP